MPTADSSAPVTRPGAGATPRVCAVLVVTDGAAWLPAVLATLAASDHPALDLVVVDNASRDGSPALLARRIPADRLITLRRRVGFGRAVSAALGAEPVARADLLLLLHDDLALAPDAIGVLAEAFRRDANLSIAGPKLREWGDLPVLTEVGMTVDRLGRAESLLEPGELDQGQHDRQREVLYVSTAGMMLRPDALREVRGFDHRYPAFRDDLDLCWRAWLRGHRVEVVPAAVAYHVVAGGRSLRRVGVPRPRPARELAERHTFATLIKCYGAARLAWVVPLVLLLAVGKVLGFALTRRFGDAAAVVRAYLWNLTQLPRTLRRRRAVQRGRVVSDGDLAALFAPGLPRVRAYSEALAGRVAGGSTKALLDDPDPEPEPQPHRPGDEPAWIRVPRQRPAACAGLALLLLYLAGSFRLFGGGPLLGGEIAPWPDSPLAFVRAWAAAWGPGPLGSDAASSPVQLALGAVSALGFWSAAVAQRLVVLGLVPLAWLAALRAGRLVTTRPAPRVLGATLYVVSPVVLGALAEGLLSVLVLAALLPALVLLAVRTVAPGELADVPGRARPDARSASAWRAAALLGLALVLAVGAAPRLWPVPALVVGTALVAALARREGVLRVLVAVGAAAVVLGPWLWGLRAQGLPPPAVDTDVPLPLWRALAVVPETLPGTAGWLGVLAAVTATAVLVAALLLGLRGRPGVVTGFAVVLVLSGLAAWGSARLDLDGAWRPALLLPAALAQAGLGAVAARWFVRGLRVHAFGLRQVAVVVSLALLALGVVGGLLRVAQGPGTALARGTGPLPAFVTADAERVGPYRVLLLRADAGEVRYDVLGPSGAVMTTFGATPSDTLADAIGSAVAVTAGGADPSAAERLGLLGVRYLVVDADPASADSGTTAQELVTALDQQPALAPEPSGGGRVYRVATWLPRAVVLPEETAEAVLTGRDPGDLAALEERGLRALGPDTFRGDGGDAGVLVLSEATSPRWEAREGALPAERVTVPDGPLRGAANAFALPAAGSTVWAEAGGPAALLQVVVPLLGGLVLVSLALRPPAPRPRRAGGRGGRGGRGGAAPLPEALTETRTPVGAG